MNELLSFNDTENNFPVSGRELHERLDVATEYRHWFPRMCEYGFVVKKDFNPVQNDRVQQEGNRTVSREVDDHMLTIGMAKELCMLQRTESGKQVRKYLISVEEQWNSPELLMARALKMADATIHKLSGEVQQLEAAVQQKEQVISELRPKADYTDFILFSTGTMAISQIAADYGLTSQKLNKILREEHVQHKVGEQWLLYQEHMGKGYTKSETIPIKRSGGVQDTRLHTRWTQKGRLLINEVLNRRRIYANPELPLSPRGQGASPKHSH